MDDKLKRLFSAARGEKSPEPSASFAERVISHLRHQPGQAEGSALDLLVLPARWVTLAAAALILIVGAIDWTLSNEPVPAEAQLDEVTSELLLRVD